MDSYHRKIKSGELLYDPYQKEAVHAFSHLHKIFKTYKPETKSLWRKALTWLKQRSPTPRGIYLYGDVGRGKSMLMDLFFKGVPTTKKCRVHFHSFMLQVHDFLHKSRTEREDKEHINADILLFADKIAKDCWLLCFDEFHVNDVADAMILQRLFTALFERGVVIVMTSNDEPGKLYKGGLQRDRFLPFIELLRERMNIIFFSGKKDYRLEKVQHIGSYFWPLNRESHNKLYEILKKLSDGITPEQTEIVFKGRTLLIPRAARKVAFFNFNELCTEAKSAADYLELVKHFNSLIIENIPPLDDTLRNETKRFITLIDTLYEHGTYLIISADLPPEQLYSGQKYSKEFRRTESRLIEMQSAEYISKNQTTKEVA